MIRDTGIYKVKILKEDVKNWNDDEFVFFVKTNDIESAKDTQSLKEEKDQLQQSHDTYVKEVWNQHIEIQNLKSQLEAEENHANNWIKECESIKKQLEQANRVIDEIEKRFTSGHNCGSYGCPLCDIYNSELKSILSQYKEKE